MVYMSSVSTNGQGKKVFFALHVVMMYCLEKSARDIGMGVGGVVLSIPQKSLSFPKTLEYLHPRHYRFYFTGSVAS